MSVPFSATFSGPLTVGDISGTFQGSFSGTLAAAPPADPPTLVSGVIPADGQSVTLTFSAAVTATAGGGGFGGCGLAIDYEAGFVANLNNPAAGNGTTELTWTLFTPAVEGATATITYATPAEGGVAGAGGELVAFTNEPVTNNSTYVPPPQVQSLDPSLGPEAGGTEVVITGLRFTGATAVAFGATPAASFVVDSATQITAVSPAGTGAAVVRVTTPDGTSSEFGYAFEYLA